MDKDIEQLRRNRAKVFMIGAGLFLLGSQGPDMGDLFGGHHHGDRRLVDERVRIEIKDDDIDVERAVKMAERAAELAERAADAADRAAEAR